VVHLVSCIDIDIKTHRSTESLVQGKPPRPARLEKYLRHGIPAKAEVVECSATELIGEYVGQTGPRVQKVLENALGRVLFVDEAYRLAGVPYAKESMD
jgi:hypothetical protein